jgi:hypothetical protein
MQSRKHSFVEACANVLIGIVVAWAVTFTIFPWFDLEPAIVTSLYISLIFTLVSLLRSYVLRRLFVYIDHRRAIARQ